MGEDLPRKIPEEAREVVRYFYVPPLPHKGNLLESRLQVCRHAQTRIRDPRGQKRGVQGLFVGVQEGSCEGIGNQV